MNTKLKNFAVTRLDSITRLTFIAHSSRAVLKHLNKNYRKYGLHTRDFTHLDIRHTHFNDSGAEVIL